MRTARPRPLAGCRIVLLAEYGTTGGTRTYFMQLVNFYLEQQVELKVVRDAPIADQEMDHFLASRNVPVVEWVSISGTTPVSLVKRLFHISSRQDLRKEKDAFRKWLQSEGVDLVVASVGTPGRFLGALASVKSGLYILHTYPHGIRSSIFSRLVMPGYFPQSAQLITVSNFAASAIVRRWRLESRRQDLHVLYSTMGLPTQNSHRSGGNPTVLSLGHVERYKGVSEWIDIAVDVISRPGMESVHFTWAGEGTLLEACKRRVRKLGLENQIQFIGPTRNIDSLYDKCQVYLQTSRVESLGLGVIDAARRGIPAVVADTGGLPEAVAAGETGRIYPLHRPKRAVEALLTLLDDDEQREAMGAGALALYERRFSPETWGSALVELHALALQHGAIHDGGLLHE